jgi:hypothetical protein
VSALDALKSHLNLLDADSDDDDLTLKLDASIAFTSQHVGALDPETGEPVALTWDTATADLQLAILQLAGHWFENRELVIVGTSANTVPLGYWDIVMQHRRWVF